MIYVCDKCSNVNIDELKKAIPADKLKVVCIAECWKYKEQAYGYFDDELIVKDTEKDFIEAAKEYSKS